MIPKCVFLFCFRYLRIFFNYNDINGSIIDDKTLMTTLVTLANDPCLFAACIVAPIVLCLCHRAFQNHLWLNIIHKIIRSK